MQMQYDLSTLYTEFGARISTYLRRLTQDAALAEELTQETFLRAFEHLPSFRREGTISNWLYRIATNLFRDSLRSRTGVTQLQWTNDSEDADNADPCAQIPDPAPPLSQVLEQQAEIQCVRACVASLPAPYRATLLLYAIEGKSVDEIATILGCSKGTVKVRLHRARHLFKALATEQCEISIENGGISCIPKETIKEVTP